jgi:hypothetical protein
MRIDHAKEVHAMDDLPEDHNGPHSSQKLVLPGIEAPFTEPQRYQEETTAFPADPLYKAGGYRATMPTHRRADPVYRFLYLSIALVITACIILLVLVGPAVANMLSHAQFSSTPTGSAGGLNPQPTFPTPGGGQGSTQSSQPTVSPVPTLLPTPTVLASPTLTPVATSTGQLTVQIISVPQFVSNNSTVMVGVTTSQSSATVQLVVSYNAFPYLYSSPKEFTDTNGFASIPWHVQVIPHGQFVVARLYVVARSQDGQQALSPEVTVQIGGHVGG